MKNKTNWRKTWNSYRKVAVESRDDLFFQVGKTVEGKKIPDKVFNLIVDKIIRYLNIGKKDVLYDLCCGNGLVTYELSKHVAKVTGIDFSEHLIEAAKMHRAAPNINYYFGEVNSALRQEVLLAESSVKFLLGDALGYFDVASFENLVGTLYAKTVGAMLPLELLVTGVPDDNLKWNFYNTEERQIEYLKQKEGDFNGCIGRWWGRDELKNIVEKYALKITFFEQDPAESTFRFDFLIKAA